jgi:hypothetical protein
MDELKGLRTEGRELRTGNGIWKWACDELSRAEFGRRKAEGGKVEAGMLGSWDARKLKGRKSL